MRTCGGEESRDRYFSGEVVQQSSEVSEKLLGLVEIYVDNLGDKVGGGFILQLLQLQELLVQYSLNHN